MRHDPEWDGGESDAARPVSVFFSRDRGMVFFLAFLVLTTTILPMISLSRLGRLAVSMAFGLTTVLGAFATIRHRTDQARGCVTRDTMLAFIYKLGMCAESRWCRIRGFQHLAKVITGVPFKDGVAVTKSADAGAPPDHALYTRFDDISCAARF